MDPRIADAGENDRVPTETKLTTIHRLGIGCDGRYEQRHCPRIIYDHRRFSSVVGFRQS